MSRENDLEELSNIIKNFRKGELSLSLDKLHIEKWLSQFSPENQDVILSETLHIFREYYFNNDYVDEKIDRIVPYLQKKFGYETISSVFDSVSFLDLQKDGNSQHTIISRFSSRVMEKYGIQIKTNITSRIKHYIYIDDGLYTGSRARKDLSDYISQLPEDSLLEVFYIIVCESPYLYTKEKLTDCAKQKNINLQMYNWKIVCNDKTSSWSSDGSKEIWNLHHNCLWPSPSTKKVAEVSEYVVKIQNLGNNVEKYLFRKEQWANDQGLFTTVCNRDIVEKEFLTQGIRILNKISDSKGMYPLGYNLWPSFGLGMFCAFDMNISNACPLVLWWGNTEKKDNILDNWYPLLPRRVNVSSESCIEPDNIVYWGERNIMDQYNMCPDCGNKFGLEDDGGNGFCVNCAWKH